MTFFSLMSIPMAMPGGATPAREVMRRRDFSLRVAQHSSGEIGTQVDAFNQKVTDAGIWVFAGGLEPIETTTTVDATGHEPIITDGPFTEAKEWIGGFWVLEAPDLDAALKLAIEASAACEGRVEVRPFQSE